LSAGEIWTTPDAIQVTRYAGPTDGTGHLLDAAALTADELADQSAWLEIIARGVQTGSHHQVFLNDTFRGFLKPSPTCEWSKTVLNIPLTDVRFPGARGSSGVPIRQAHVADHPDPREQQLSTVLC
jgi:hypothetical protein